MPFVCLFTLVETTAFAFAAGPMSSGLAPNHLGFALTWWLKETPAPFSSQLWQGGSSWNPALTQEKGVGVSLPTTALGLRRAVGCVFSTPQQGGQRVMLPQGGNEGLPCEPSLTPFSRPAPAHTLPAQQVQAALPNAGWQLLPPAPQGKAVAQADEI